MHIQYIYGVCWQSQQSFEKDFMDANRFVKIMTT